MQQWLNFIPAASALAGLAADIVNLAITLAVRHDAVANTCKTTGGPAHSAEPVPAADETRNS